MNQRTRQFNDQRRWHAAWMLLAVLVWVAAPVGSSLFCHDDSSHDHSSLTSDAGHYHESSSQDGSTAQAGHHHTDGSTHVHAASLTELSPANAPDGHSHESCCCAPDDTSAALAATAPSLSPGFVHHVLVSPAVAAPQPFVSETTVHIFSRAGPDAPTILSQLRRSSLLHRAPPISA